jgi:hypothetical protein
MLKIGEAAVKHVATGDEGTKALERAKHGKFLEVLRLVEIGD